jgi:glycine/D-amino acid oxidase-like deaminating enzyme
MRGVQTMKVTHLPKDDASCGWLALLGELPPPRPLLGAHRAEWVVVGAGCTGLAAARRLAELLPETRILLLDGQRVGEGASGRNSGFIIDLPHNVDAQDIEDRAANERVQRLNLAAIAELKGLVDRHAIACDWQRGSKIHAAAEPVGERELDALAAGLRRLDVPFQEPDGDALAAMLGTGWYRRGLITEGCITVQPAALVRGLAEALPANVALHENSPVTELRRLGGGWEVSTRDGSVRAGGVILATDAFARAFGVLRDRLVPIYTYASLTRPLPELGGLPTWALLPAHKAGTTLRRLADGRVLVRNSFRYGGDFQCTEKHLAWARRRHEASFHARWPRVAPDFQWSWGGVIAFTRNFAPYFGQLEPGLYASVGSNGVGLAKGTIGGRLLAEMALGQGSALLDDMRAYPMPPRNPPEPLLGLGAGLRLGWEQMRAGREA